MFTPPSFLTESCDVVLKPGLKFFCNSPQFSNVQVHVFSFVYFHHSVLHFDVLKECFLQQNANYSGSVERLWHYSSTVLLFGNQHVDRSLFSFCDSVFNGVCI